MNFHKSRPICSLYFSSTTFFHLFCISGEALVLTTLFRAETKSCLDSKTGYFIFLEYQVAGRIFTGTDCFH